MVYNLVPEYDDKAIKISTGFELGLKPKDPAMFLDTTTIYYGASNSGKSTAMMEQLYLLKDLIPKYVVFCPSNEQNGSYSGVIPQKLIYSKITKQKLIEIFNDQANTAKLYRMVNNIDNLRCVFSKLKSHPTFTSTYYQTIENIKQYEHKTNNFINGVNNNNEISYVDKKKLEARALSKKEEDIIGMYKKAIKKHQKSLLSILTEPHYQTIVKYLDLNPRLLIIFDDCAEYIKCISKQSSKSRDGHEDDSIISTYFTRARHNFITLMVSTQDDNMMTTTMRKNTMYSIFTEQECAIHFMRSTANGISGVKRKRAEAAIEAVFGDTTDDNHKKLVYYRLGNKSSQFTYMIADIYPKFRLCDDIVWKFCAKIEEQHKDKDKQFLSSWTI